MSSRSSFLLVKVRPEGWRWPLVLPVPLFMLEDVLESCGQLARLVRWLGWPAGQRWAKAVPESWLVAGLDVPAAAVRCLRDHGPFTLAEIREGGTHVAVRLM